MTTIHPIHLSISNAYLVKGPVNMLIDTGSPGEGKKILNFLRKHGLQLSDIALILHTHGHSDHCGSTRELLHQCKIPTALHPGDLPMATSGKNGPISTTTLFSKILVPLVDKPYMPYTPGHSKGSVSIEFDNGEMVIGDILMGGMLGGAIFPGRPGYHYFIEDRTEVHRSIERVLDRPVQRYWVGHGGPLKANDVRNWYLRKSSRS